MTDQTSEPLVAAILPRTMWQAFIISRWGVWTVLLGKYVSIQVIVQLLGFASSLLIIRLMPQKEYAYYTIANTMQGTMNLLADMGIGIGISAIGGRVWRERFQLGQVITTAISLRKRLALGSALSVIPILTYLLLHQGAPTAYVMLLATIVLGSLTAQLSASVLIAVPRFHAEVSRLQRLDLIVAITKLILVVALCRLFMNSATAMLIGSVTVAMPLLFLRPWARESADLNAPLNPTFRKEMIGIIKNQAPNAIFYCLQSQISIWLISFFGKSQSVAEIGALGRLAVVFTIVSSVMNNILVPRFARCQGKKTVLKRFWQISLVALLLSCAIICGACVFTAPCLWLLGPQYQHLQLEFILCVINVVYTFFIGTLWSLNSARAWIQRSWLYIPLTLITQVALLKFVNLSNMRDVLLFGIISQTPLLLVNFYIFRRGFNAEFNKPFEEVKTVL